MRKLDIVRSAWDWNTPNRESFWADEFQSTDDLGSPPVDKSMWVMMARLLKASFPDMSEVVDDIREEDDHVVVTSHFYGTFTNDFDLSAMGLGIIPATGAMIVFPKNTARVSFDGDQISRLHSLGTGPDSGMPGFLKALGVAMG